MDEMRLKLRTNFMKGIVAKIIAKKTGYNMSISINELDAKTTDGLVQLHIDADAAVTKEEFVKILKNLGLD